MTDFQDRARGLASAWALCFGVMLAPQGAQAGAWPQAPGSGQIILTATYDLAVKGFDRDGALRDPVRYEKTELSAFVEYGLFSRVTLVGRAALQDVTIQTPAGREQREGFAASEIGVRVLALRRARDVLSVQGTLIVPGVVENVSDLRLGEGQYDYEPRLLYGRSFRALGGDGFAEAQFGWRFRSGAPPDEARVDLTLGLTRGKWMGLAQVFGLRGTNASPPRRDYDSVKLQASIVYEIAAGTRVQAGAFHTVWGRSIVQEMAAFAALWRAF